MRSCYERGQEDAVDPVSGNYVFGSPLFRKAALDLGGGKKLVIEGVGNAPNRPY